MNSNPLARPPRRHQFAFMLTPLVDVMFLLLIFFMLASQTAPYSLLSIIAPGATAEGTSAAPAAGPAATAPPRQVLVSIYHGYVRYDGAETPLAGLGAAIARSKAAGLSSAVVLTTPQATVQDVVSVIEAFDTSDFGDMRLIMQQGQTP
jgi:biopolymer transport protein ExbD